MTLEEAAANIDRFVIYNSGNGHPENGFIVAANDKWVFVRYMGDTTAKATDPADLTFLSKRNHASN